MNIIKRNIKKPNTEPQYFLQNHMGIKLAALALALGIGAFSVVYRPEGSITIGVTKDSIKDEYEQSIPLFSDIDAKKLLTTIAANRIIISQDHLKYSNPNRLHLVSAIDNDNQLITGYTYRKYIDQCTTISKENASFLYRVNSENGLNLRSTPEISDNKLIGIPNQSILLGAEPQNDDNCWTNVIYFNGSTINEGFASGKYLKPIYYINDNKAKDFEIYSPKHHEFGIDVSTIEPKILDKLLNGEIKLPEMVEQTSGKKLSISEYDRNIKFVYIKLMGTTVYSKALRQGKPTPYLELARICEKNKIPYGFYCYSTCTTPAEAKQEYQWFSEAFKKVKDQPYNLLPLAIDVEVASDRDRQYNVTMQELTNAKITLANMLEKDFGKTIIYLPRNAHDSNLKSRILDLEQYQKGLTSGDSHVWHVTPIDGKLHQRSFKKIAEFVSANQIALDIEVTKHNLIDINLMRKEAFNSYITGQYQAINQKTTTDKTITLAQNDEHEK